MTVGCVKYNEYVICKVQYVKGGPAGRAGFESMFYWLENPLPRSRIGYPMCFELESSSRRSIRFGMWEAKKWNYEGKHCCCCLHPLKTFFEGGKPPLQKRSNAFSDSHPSSGRRKAQCEKRGEGVHPPHPLTILPAPSSPHLPNKGRSFCSHLNPYSS